MSVKASCAKQAVFTMPTESRVAFLSKCTQKSACPHPEESVPDSSNRVISSCKKLHTESGFAPHEPIRLTPRQTQRLNRLIINECCNHVDGICIVQDNGYGQYCPQMGMRTLFCPWLREAVLPLDEVLRCDLMRDLPLKTCEMCGKKFSPKSNRARFCPACAVKNRRRKQAEWIREKRMSCRRLGSCEAPCGADLESANRGTRQIHPKDGTCGL